MRTEDEKVDAGGHQRLNSKALSDGSSFVQEVPQQNAAGQIRAGDAVARVAEREQMMRKVPVRSDVRQTLGGLRVVDAPAVLGLDARRCPDTAPTARTSVGRSAGRSLSLLDAPGGVSMSAPITINRSSSSHRTTWYGSAESRTTVLRLPSCLRIFAGTGSVSATYVVRNQKCRRSDLWNSVVGVPVATMTLRVRIVPPAVKTSAIFRLNVMRLTGDFSKSSPPRSPAASARPTHARYGSIVRAFASAKRHGRARARLRC